MWGKGIRPHKEHGQSVDFSLRVNMTSDSECLCNTKHYQHTEWHPSTCFILQFEMFCLQRASETKSGTIGVAIPGGQIRLVFICLHVITWLSREWEERWEVQKNLEEQHEREDMVQRHNRFCPDHCSAHRVRPAGTSVPPVWGIPQSPLWRVCFLWRWGARSPHSGPPQTSSNLWGSPAETMMRRHAQG